jgi:septum formation protein
LSAGPLVLASGSPQRRAILEQLGVRFVVRVPGVEESSAGDPRERVAENARLKARAVDGERVLGADTVVTAGDAAFGKPADADEAERFLRRLSGRDHEVMTGIAYRSGPEESGDVAVTRVTFRELGEADIRWYLDTGEWRGRAGGYAIQGRGAALVERIEGDYWNVVGLPVPALLRLVPGLLRD